MSTDAVEVIAQEIRLRTANTKLIEAVEAWHEYWEDRYDGEPLKDHEVKLLAAAALIASLKGQVWPLVQRESSPPTQLAWKIATDALAMPGWDQDEMICALTNIARVLSPK